MFAGFGTRRPEVNRRAAYLPSRPPLVKSIVIARKSIHEIVRLVQQSKPKLP